MKVTLEKNYRDIYTLTELDNAKYVIAQMKYDTETPKAYAEIAVAEALKDSGDYADEIIQATATTTKNRNIYGAWGNESGQIDIWIEAIASTWKGFICVGAYLTDIWKVGAEDIRNYMWTRYYTQSPLPEK